MLEFYIHFLEYNSRSLIYHRIKCLRNCKFQFSIDDIMLIFHRVFDENYSFFDSISRFSLDESFLSCTFISRTKLLRFIFELTIIARKVFWFFTMITVEIVHLIVWWLSNHTKTRSRDFKSWAWDRFVSVLIVLIILIRVNDDNYFFISCCIINIIIIIEIFSDVSRFIFNVFQNLIRVSTHFNEFVKISRFIRLNNKNLLQLVRHFLQVTSFDYEILNHWLIFEI